MDNRKKGQDGEDFVNTIAFNTFLKHWCFPSPTNVLGDKKEICDLLIVFGSICLIISVKNYAFKGNYDRYARNTVDKAIRQISGAERKLFGSQAIALKHPDREMEEFKKKEIKKIVRIIVNLNSSLKFYQTSYHIKGKDFTVMDADSWKHSIAELNTLPDFIKYIENRCSIFRKFPAFILPKDELDFSEEDRNQLDLQLQKHSNSPYLTLVSGTELDLIALYITNGFKFYEDIKDSNVEIIFLPIEGKWEKYKASDLFKTKGHYEFLGGFIDQLVKELIINQANGGRLSKMFFQLDRLQRSVLAEAFLTFHQEEAHSKEPAAFFRRHLQFHNLRFIFIYFADDYPKEMVEAEMYLSFEHYNYLFDFTLTEIGAIAISKSLLNFCFGYYGEQQRHSIKEIAELETMFKKYGWKIKEK